MPYARFLFLFIAFLSFGPSELTAQCGARPVFDGAYRWSILDVELSGTDLWAATSFGVALYDASVDPPRPLYSLALAGNTSRVRLVQGFAYVGSGERLHVLRKGNRKLDLVGGVNLGNGATVNDLIYVAPYLYAATAIGVIQIDISNPSSPAVAAKLSTTSGRALSLARYEATLYAADGDRSIEMYSIQVPAFPQKIGTFDALPTSTSVRVSGNKIFVSDGQRTQTFSAGGNPPASLGIAPSVAAAAIFPLTSNIIAVGGGNRHVQIVDFGVPSQATVLFDLELSISRGTINRIGAITGDGKRLYVAAGDIGIVSLNIESFKAPYPLRVTSLGELSSIVRTASGIAVAPVEGGLATYVMASDDSLTRNVTWESGKNWTLQDAVGALVVASLARTVTIWNTTPLSPTVTSSGNFPKNVTSAILVGNTVYALLVDGAVWRADASQPQLTPTLVVTGTAPLLAMARNGNVVAAVEVNAAGNSVVSYWSDGDLSKAPVRKEVEGAATSGVAVMEGRAAVATFKGLTVITFPSAAATTVSGVPPGRAIAFSGTSIVYATTNSLLVFDSLTPRLVATYALPQSVNAIQHGESSAPFFVATTEGLASLRTVGTAAPPASSVAALANNYYKSFAVTKGKVVLLDAPNVEILTIRNSGVPTQFGRFSVDGGAVDVAADEAHVFILTGGAAVISYGYGGREERRISLGGSDVVPIRARMVGRALHVAYRSGCPLACTFQTAVLDPSTLAQTSLYDGALLDSATVGNVAYVLVEQPSEIRKLNIADPLRPSTTLAVASQGSPVSIAYSTSAKAVYTLGTKMYVHDENSLSKIGETLSNYVTDPSGRISYLDQRVRIAGDCVVMSGRSFSPEFGTLVNATTLGTLQSVPMPAAVKRFEYADGVWYYLTDYSLDVFTVRPPSKRQRGVQ